MEKLNKLIQECKCGVHIIVNSHKDYYESVEKHFKDNPIKSEDLEYIESEVYEKMKELDTIIEIQCYPNTPIGSFTVYHYDLELAIDEALK